MVEGVGGGWFRGPCSGRDRRLARVGREIRRRPGRLRQVDLRRASGPPGRRGRTRDLCLPAPEGRRADDRGCGDHEDGLVPRQQDPGGLPGRPGSASFCERGGRLGVAMVGERGPPRRLAADPGRPRKRRAPTRRRGVGAGHGRGERAQADPPRALHGGERRLREHIQSAARDEARGGRRGGPRRVPADQHGAVGPDQGRRPRRSAPRRGEDRRHDDGAGGRADAVAVRGRHRQVARIRPGSGAGPVGPGGVSRRGGDQAVRGSNPHPGVGAGTSSTDITAGRASS